MLKCSQWQPRLLMFSMNCLALPKYDFRRWLLYPNQKQRRQWSSLEKRQFAMFKYWRLTAEVWSPPLVDFGSSTLASISVGLELITQYMLLAAEPTHVIHAALEERSGIHHADTLPGTEKTRIHIGEKFRVQFCVRYRQFGLAHVGNVGYLSINQIKTLLQRQNGNIKPDFLNCTCLWQNFT